MGVDVCRTHDFREPWSARNAPVSAPRQPDLDVVVQTGERTSGGWATRPPFIAALAAGEVSDQLSTVDRALPGWAREGAGAAAD